MADGNIAAMREALQDVLFMAEKHAANSPATSAVIFDRDTGKVAREIDYLQAIEKARFALGAPARNCDVGTAEEQAARFTKICVANSRDGVRGLCSETCPFNRDYQAECALAWAQMPYEAGGKR